MVNILRTTSAALLAGTLAGVAPLAAVDPPPSACEAGEAERDRCQGLYESGYRMTCFRDGEPVFEGDVWRLRKVDRDPLPYVRAEGKPVEPLWETYGACKIRRGE